MSDTTEVYGYSVLCEFREPDGTIALKMFRSKGKSETRARRVPIFKRGFVRVIEIESCTRGQWLRIFGEGRM